MNPHQSKSNASLFHSLAAIIAPPGTILPVSKTVSSLSFDTTTDKITVTLDTYDNLDNKDTETIEISHNDFMAWVESKDYLCIETGGHSCDGGKYEDSTNTATIGYAEFLQDHLTGVMIKEYLIEKKLVTYGFDEHAA